MPIRPELRHFYRTPEYKAARERIVARAKNKCEQCGKRNHRRVHARYLMGRMWWSYSATVWRDQHGKKNVPPRAARHTRVKVVCTMAHLDHNPANNADDNLKLLCQWCHLNYDKQHHKETRSIRKDNSRPLFAPHTTIDNESQDRTK